MHQSVARTRTGYTGSTCDALTERMSSEPRMTLASREFHKLEKIRSTRAGEENPENPLHVMKLGDQQ